MVIDIAGIIYMILAFYILGAILITGALTLGIWGFLKLKRRASEKALKQKNDNPIIPNPPSPNLPRPQAHAM